ncbi:MAG: ABC transporter substrate-binding protein [Lachnospiraceae bacterium]|nr:ABC transporter substrate-binding protein [Lachnospiraceae bacterium]
MKKKLLSLVSVLLIAGMILALSACSGGGQQGGGGGQESGESGGGDAKDSFVVGICQLVQHPALDAATQGFKDAITEALGDKVTFEDGNGSGDSATCATICNGFVSDGVDLIMANATPALQAAASATDSIPILGTSVTTYDAALNLENFDGTVGGNISGTSDLSPIDQQAQMIKDLFPDAKTVGVIYCTAEANSVYQVEAITKELTALGFTVTPYSFADSNDVALVTGQACDENDILYIPTDNTAASCAEAIDGVARPAQTPIFAAEEGICAACGVATLTIDYYELGKVTGNMAVKILTGEANVSEMPIEYYTNPVKKYNPELAELYGVTIPDDYVAME